MDIVTLALAKKYVKKSLAGGGAVVGKNVIISSIVPIEGGNRITFSYTLDDGTTETSTLDVMDGVDGVDGEKGEKGDKGDSIRGADGITPQFTIGTVTTVSSDEEASASITGTSANPILNLNIPKGESGSDINSSDEKVKLTSSSANAHYLGDWIDNTTIEIDTVNNRLVVKKVDGQTATVAEINFLSGVTSNIQEQINNLGKSMTMYGVFDTKADLIAANSPVPVDGNTAIVVADEDNDGKQMTYIYIAADSAWTQVAESSVSIRDFTANPINLSTETTGVLPREKIDNAIARLADVLDKATYKGSADGVVKQADSITGMTATIAQLNETIEKSHTHINKAALDKIIANGLGNRILADNGTYKEFLVLSSTAPNDTYTLWVDNSNSTKPILKIYDGTNWIAVSGSSDITVDTALSNTSENAVQNKVVKAELDKKSKVEVSDKNGNVKINGTETTVYVLPAATENTLGGVKVDGTTVIISKNGVLSAIAGGSSVDVAANAGAHNSIYRGAYLGDSVTDAQYAQIAAGTFDNLYIGDYWTINGINWRIAAFDYYLNTGDTTTTAHHIVIVPDTTLYDAQMNSTNTNDGGYVGSEMYKTGLNQAKTIINTTFSGHVLKHRIYLINAVKDGAPSNGAWCDSDVDLMNEQMVYGGSVYMSSVYKDIVPIYHRVEKSQLPLFTYRPDLISSLLRVAYWLRDSVATNRFASIAGSGFAHNRVSSITQGVRPFFCVY